jgi:hypothetical protein
MRKGVEKEVLNLERQFWQSMKDKDAETAKQLTDFPCIVVGPQGIAQADEKMFMAMMQESPSDLEEFTLGDVEFRQISDDVAIVAYKAHEELRVDGKPVALDAAEASVWVRRDGKWQCALHTESLTGDPYGRDRRQTA